jgi:hypothetical protein
MPAADGYKRANDPDSSGFMMINRRRLLFGWEAPLERFASSDSESLSVGVLLCTSMGSLRAID